jgi:ABC-type glycerol-3-phosphate transport system substrate-binding protein
MKRALALAIAATMVLALCPVALGTALAEGETLTMLQRLPATYVVEGNPIIKAWGDMYGVTIEIEAPPISSFNDRRNVIMASGDLPDLIYVGDTGALYTQWSNDGLLLNLDPYFVPEIMPNATATLQPDELFAVTITDADGSKSLYSLPRVQTKPYDALMFRADWLEKLELDVPRTPGDFAEVMLAFTTQDPDGNGINDTFGWSLNTAMGAEHRSLLSAFGTHPTEVPDEGGEYALLQTQPGYKAYLDWCREMYANGSLDPEFYITKMYEDDDLFSAGKFGVVYSNKVVEHLGALNDSTSPLKSAFPEARIAAAPPLIAEGQSVANVWYNPQIWGNYAINADSNLIDLAIKVLDGGYTDEVNELLNVGIEGITYTAWDPVARFASKTKEQSENATSYTATYATINYQRADKGLLVATANNEEQLTAFNEAQERIGSVTNRVSYLGGAGVPGYGDLAIARTESGIDDAWNETRTKYITGEINEDELTSFINDKMLPAYQPLLDLYAAYNDGEGFNASVKLP